VTISVHPPAGDRDWGGRLPRNEALDLDDDQRTAHRFADELVRTHRVADATYAAAEVAFGRDGVLDMVHLVGMYLATSALLNAFEIPAPPIPD
jgi:4-carboxymuconolactone decarboxylase